MTEQQRLEIVVGMRVMVKVASREIPATVVEVGENWFLVRSNSTGREFRTTRVVDILDAPETDETEIAQAAADIADEEAATAELRSREENGEADEPKSEPPKADEPKAEEPPKADEAAPAVAETAAPRRNLSLVDAAVEVLRAEKRPMGVKELVKLATERGLWISTKAKTPEQSLYGGLYLEMKNSSHPRIKKSAEKGRFELIG